MNLRCLPRTLRRFLSLGAVVGPSPNAGMTISGNVPDLGSLINAIATLQANAQSAAGGITFVTSSGTSATLTALGNYLYQFTAGSATTLTLDYAYNIVNALPQPVFLGQKFQFQIQTNASTTIATPTLSSSSGGVTLAGGSTAVLAASSRFYQGQITQLTSTTGMPTTSGTTFTSLTQVGSTNAYTVVLGTNALVPVAGQLINLTVTAGTLPSGWYPISKVTSATSFVIMAPKGVAAWTATAATVGTGVVAPATFSPLVTITGLWALVVSTASV